MSESDNNKSGGGHTGAVLLGIAIGLTIGFLFAPDKGSKTRGDIKKKLGDLADLFMGDDAEEDSPENSEA